MIIRRTKIGTTPVTVEEAKQHLRLAGDTFDSILTGYIEAAVDHAENVTGLVLRDGSQYEVVDEYSETVRTGILPIRSVRVEVDSTPTDEYTVEGSAVLLPADPTARIAEVEVETGFDRFPDGIKAAILLIVGKLFANPADGVENLPSASTNLLRNYRRWDN